MNAPKTGWWLLLVSLSANAVLAGWVYFERHQGNRDQQALVFALDRCQGRLERYAEVKAVADAFDKMLEEKEGK